MDEDRVVRDKSPDGRKYVGRSRKWWSDNGKA